MELAAQVNRRESDADIAVRLLRETRTPIHYKDIINNILQARGQSTEISSLLMAQMLTQINIDARFIHMGKGIWGLRDWNPAAAKPVAVEKPRVVRKVALSLDDDLDDDLIDEDEDGDDLALVEDGDIIDDDDEFADTEELEEIDDDEDTDEEQP